MDWDDIRYYLAVARHGSIRGASNHLSVNPSTVSRRIDAYEKKIGVRLFERLPSGYALTKTGQDMMISAELIENEIASLDRRVTGRDAELNGKLRVTLPAPLATHLLMQDIAEFEQKYPHINIELHTSYDVLNLSKREADIAIRITDHPAEHLIGKKVANLSFSTYASIDYITKHDLKNSPQNAQWIQHTCSESSTDWIDKSIFKQAPIKHLMSDPAVVFQAVKSGMGIAKLACFMADADPDLQRIDDIESNDYSDIWLLSHKDLRSTARVKVFIDFMTEAFKQHQQKLTGSRTISPVSIWGNRTITA